MEKKPTETFEESLSGETRATFIVKQIHVDILKALSYWERVSQKDLIDEAIKLLLKSRSTETMFSAIQSYTQTKNTK